VRMRASSATAATLADRLADHPAVDRVHYPSRRANRPNQMTSGGAIVSFEVAGDPHAVIAAVRLITPAVSLGSVDSLIQHPGSLTHHIVDPADRAEMGISEQLLRLSVGLEDAEDLWSDLDVALRA
jgi:methionine-gamma-lyase